MKYIGENAIKKLISLIKGEMNNKLGTSGDGSNVTAAFTAAGTRTNISTGEKLSVLFGKIAKWFADLKTVAFTGSYNDLTDKPTIPTVPTKVSAFTNDAGYLTSHQSLAAYRTASAQDAIDAGKVDDFTLDLYTGSAGNPRPVKFLTVNYAGTDSNNAIFVMLSAMSCHPNGSSYKFAEDIAIGVTYTGAVGVDVQQSIRQSCGVVDGSEHFYGDVFYVVNTDTTTVDFFIYCGQWAHTKFTPYKRRNGAAGGTITQYNGTATYYSDGTKVYGNNGLIAMRGDIPNIPTVLPVEFTTIAPTADNTVGLKFAVLSAEPETKYNGWVYLITEA